MRYLVVSAAAAMALVGAASFGNAQAPDSNKRTGPAAEGQAPGSGGAQPGKSESQQPKSTQGRPETGKQRSKSATQPQRDKDQQRSSQQRQGDKDQKKSANEQRDRAKDQRKSTQTQPGIDRQKATQGADQKQGGRIQIGEQERNGVRDRIMKDRRVERAKVDVSINIGTRLPRSVRLHTLPIAIVSFAPAYRGYSYVMLEDETICIVDPRTYAIVDVIPVGTQRADRAGRTHLTLSTEDLRFIYRTVPKNRTANVRVRMALGAEVPRDIDLIEFPAEVVERVPDVRRYRYIVTETDVVVVDPDDHAVVLVINE